MTTGRPPIEVGTARRQPDGTFKFMSKKTGSPKWVRESTYLKHYGEKPEIPEELIRRPAAEPPAPEAEPPTPAAEPPAPAVSDDAADFEADFGDLLSLMDEEPTEEAESLSESTTEGQNVIKGKQLLFLIDLAGSRLASLILKKTKVSDQPHTDYKLTPEERKELEEVADEAAKTIVLSDNPWLNLGLGYALLVGTKVKPKAAKNG